VPVQAAVGLKPPHEIEVVVYEAANLRKVQALGQQVRCPGRRALAAPDLASAASGVRSVRVRARPFPTSSPSRH